MVGARPALDVLIDHFADDPALLVLDNLEQIVGVAPSLDQLLARCPGVEILAPSRTVLRLRADREYAFDALTVPAISDPLTTDELASLPAVRSAFAAGEIVALKQMGLGLAIARGLVEAHRGRIAARNHGDGCRFEVRLPLAV